MFLYIMSTLAVLTNKVLATPSVHMDDILGSGPAIVEWKFHSAEWDNKDETFSIDLTSDTKKMVFQFTVKEMNNLLDCMTRQEWKGINLGTKFIKPSQLVGYVFKYEIEEKEVPADFNSLSWEAQKLRSLYPKVFEGVASALAKGEPPKFNDEFIIKKLLKKAFDDALSGKNRERWFAWMQQWVNEISGGKSHLIKVEPNEFSRSFRERFMGTGLFAVLIDINGRKNYLVFSTIQNYVVFDNKKHRK